MKNNILYGFVQYLNLCISTFILLSQTTSCDDPHFLACAPKYCGNRTIKYPFYIEGEQNRSCGFPGFNISCHENVPILRKPNNDFRIQQIFYTDRSLHLLDTSILNLKNGCFPKINNISLDVDKFTILPTFSRNLFLLSNCSAYPKNLSEYKIGCDEENKYGNGLGFGVFEGQESLSYAMGICKVVVLAKVEMEKNDGIMNYLEVLKRGIVVRWIASDCGDCERSGGRCGFDEDSFNFRCFCRDRPHKVRCNSTAFLDITAHHQSSIPATCKSAKNYLRVILLAVILGCVIIIMCILTIRYRKKWKDASTYISSRNILSNPSYKSGRERDGFFLGVPVFSYIELEEATSNFNRELGDGGFGTVYYGKLRDGREVAVKRLYEQNYKGLSQFRNEIEILTRLRHKNLVILYGCNSRQSRELLLVYEYISNGTVADHLHGDRAQEGQLTWPIRINIAIETASALTYLHKSDVIHRDVKTNNILLDNNFSVKIADFGLSRLFPSNATHVSTAPQGTPGYVDPEYHQCYQLTDKSDVYSFGVVLIELVSSMPAVDITRHRYEINLANLAMNKIQNNAFEDLVDPCLGFDSDTTVERMIASVVEVAFRCLQQEKEMRPTMEEVLDTLREIRDYKDDKNIKDGNNMDTKPLSYSHETDRVVLFKVSEIPPSPISVVDKWVSSSTSISST